MPSPTRDLSDLSQTLAELSDDAVIILNADGIIRFWNAPAERMCGWTAAEAVGQPFSLIVPSDRVEEAAALRRRAASGQIVHHVDTIRRRNDGQLLKVTLTLAPAHSPDGSIDGYVVILRDVSAHDRSQRAARRLAAIVDSSDDAIVSKDLDGVVMSWNFAAERMFGWSAAEMIGRSIRIIVPADRQNEEEDVLARIRRGDRLEHFHTVRQRKDGSTLNISLTVSPIRDDNGAVVGASKIARDISALTQSEAERVRLLAESQENAAVAEKLNAVGTVVAAGLDHERIAQAVTDAATELTTAAFGAFFYNVVDDSGGAYTLYTISGVPRAAFSSFPMPRNTAIFDPTFRGTHVVRSDDITKDERYGQHAPHHGMPPGHLPVRSYLAVPVRSRSGEVLGGLFFGHSDVGRFLERHERLAVGIAAWASVALENARLYISVQEVSRLKDEFLASLSHELRTPLNAILGYSQMLRTGIVSDANRGRALDTIERNATSLAQIVEDVLDVSRIVVGKMRLDVKPVDIAAVFRDAIEAVLPAAAAKGIRLETHLDATMPRLNADPARLQQILWNLLSNAVKFTNRGGRVVATARQRDDTVELIVTDTGIGISPAFLPFIFERFRQADGGTSRERGGLGLGLSIARQLAEMHGGTIHASSDGLDTGSSFRVVIPIAASALDNAADA